MRFIWSDAGDDPSWGIGDKHGIDGYFAPLWDALTPEVLDEAQRRGHAIGVYYGHGWKPDWSAERLASEVSAEYRRLGGKARKLRVMFNLEQHDPEFIADTLEEWREREPFVNTSWSPAGMQGGWMGPVTQQPSEFVQRVLACRVRVAPQGFWGPDGTIQGDFAHDEVLRDLTRRGFPESVVSIFHDAKTAPSKRNWQGFAFTMGRLPA